jgi:hypothetical protein
VTTEETARFIKDIEAVYPNYFRSADLTLVVKHWGAIFNGIEYEFAIKGLYEVVRETSNAHPSANELYQKAKEVKRYEYLINGGIIGG